MVESKELGRVRVRVRDLSIAPTLKTTVLGRGVVGVMAGKNVGQACGIPVTGTFEAAWFAPQSAFGALYQRLSRCGAGVGDCELAVMGCAMGGSVWTAMRISA